MFVDKAKIHIKAGDGGDGKVSFIRAKYVPDGGPDGGDGGKGGSVIFVVDEGMHTLMDFRYKRKHVAEVGGDGGTRNCFGKSGEDLLIKVPAGTIIREVTTGLLIGDLKKHGDRVIAAKGGRGGQGNQHYATPTRQAPRFAQPGEKGIELDVELEMKLLADVGLVGFPNVGKSTFLSSVTAAKPKIANYHFTTLTPNLGVVDLGQSRSFVLADIPGLIEGAAQGAGLGHEFLRHVDRTKVLIHVLDISGIEGRDPIEDFEKINAELSLYSDKLSTKPQVIACNKIDLLENNDEYERISKVLNERGYTTFAISAATKQGVEDVLLKAYTILQTIPKEEEIPEEEYYKEIPQKAYTIFKADEIYVVEGPFVDRLLSSVNVWDSESVKYFQKVLKNKGVIIALKEAGITDGDIVKMGDIEFEFYD